MKKAVSLLLVPVLAGCLSSTMPTVSHWLLEYGGPKAVSSPRYGTARVSQIVIAPPYDSSRLTVLRADGTVAFDPYNEFAAPPSQLLKGVLRDAAIGSGLFQSVVGPTSSSATAVTLEIVVTKLLLDCRTEGSRRACASVLVRVSDRREVAAERQGSGEADAADGNYGKALSAAVSEALAEAFGKIR